MNRRAVVMILVPAFLIAASGCAVYKYTDAPAISLKSVDGSDQNKVRIRSLVLDTKEKVTFAKPKIGSLKGTTIRGTAEVSDLEIPLTRIARIEKSPSGRVQQVRLHDGTIYEVAYCSQSRDWIRITGSTQAAYPLTRVSWVILRKTDYFLSILATLALPMALFAVSAASFSGFGCGGGFGNFSLGVW